MGTGERWDTRQARLRPGGILQQQAKRVTGVISMDVVSCHISMPCWEGHNPSLPVPGFVRARGFFPDPKYLVRAGEMLPRDISRSWKNNLSPPAFLLEQQQPAPQKSVGDVEGVRRRKRRRRVEGRAGGEHHGLLLTQPRSSPDDEPKTVGAVQGRTW